MPLVPTCDCCTYAKATLCGGQDTTGAPGIYLRGAMLDELNPLIYGTRYFMYHRWCYQISRDAPRGRMAQGGLLLGSWGEDYDDCSQCFADLCDPTAPPEECDYNGAHHESPGGPGGGGCPPGALCPSCGGFGCVTNVDVVNRTWRCEGCGTGWYSGGDSGGGPHCPNPPCENDGDDGSPCDRGESGHKTVRATPCAGNNPNLPPGGTIWICVPEDTPSGTYHGRFGNYCYQFTVGSGSDSPPAGVTTSTLNGSYSSCADCLGGAPAMVCPNQQIPPGWQVPWVRASFLSTMTSNAVIFRHEGVCCHVSKHTLTRDIPENVDLLEPTGQYSDCTECTGGWLATLCSQDQQSNVELAPVVWVPSHDVPDGVHFFAYRGWCWRLDTSEPLQKRPAEAQTVVPKTGEFASCPDCLCGNRIPPQGAQAVPCEDQDDLVDLLRNLWVREEHLPGDDRYFRHLGVCYHVPAGAVVQDIPRDAQIVRPGWAYVNCRDCTADSSPPPAPPPPECPPGQHWDGTQCVEDAPDPHDCATGFHWDEVLGYCVQDPTPPECPEGQYWDGTQCAKEPEDPEEPRDCAPGFYWDGRRCRPTGDPPTPPPTPPHPPKPCKSGTEWNPLTGRCELVEEPTEPFSLELYRCAYTDREGTHYPETATGMFATAVGCPSGYTWNTATQRCEKEGNSPRQLVSYGIAGKVYNLGASSGTCACYRASAVRQAGEGLDLSDAEAHHACDACEINCQWIQLQACGGSLVNKWILARDAILAARDVMRIGDQCYTLSGNRATLGEIPPDHELTPPEEWLDTCDNPACPQPCGPVPEVCPADIPASYLVSFRILMRHPFTLETWCELDLSIPLTETGPCVFEGIMPYACNGGTLTATAKAELFAGTGWLLSLFAGLSARFAEQMSLCGRSPDEPRWSDMDNSSMGNTPTVEFTNITITAVNPLI